MMGVLSMLRKKGRAHSLRLKKKNYCVAIIHIYAREANIAFGSILADR